MNIFGYVINVRWVVRYCQPPRAKLRPPQPPRCLFMPCMACCQDVDPFRTGNADTCIGFARGGCPPPLNPSLSCYAVEELCQSHNFKISTSIIQAFCLQVVEAGPPLCCAAQARFKHHPASKNRTHMGPSERMMQAYIGFADGRCAPPNPPTFCTCRA